MQMIDDLIVEPAEISGNGCIVDVSRVDVGWKVRFASEPRTSPQPLWFYIEARGAGGAPVEFIWENPDICLGNRNELHVLRPVLRADDGQWRRVDAVKVDEHPDGRRSLRFSHEGGGRTIAAAFCFPYAPPDLEETLGDVGERWERTVIGVTREGRPLERLRLTGDHSVQRAGIYLMARQHAGETPGSWILDGMLRFLAGQAAQRSELRDAIDVWVCPFVDLDGVVNGDYGKDALPWDFNRAWEHMPMRPAVHAIQRDMQRFKARTHPRIVIDCHGPGHSTPGVYVQLPRAERPEAQMLGAREFAADLARHLSEMPAELCARETTYASRWNKLATQASWVWDALDQTQAVSVETSYQRLGDRLLYPADYHDIGQRVLLAAEDWLRRRRGG
ncbi:MAG: M14 family zinc carboxypeptidase [Armatimonadota bacterium]